MYGYSPQAYEANYILSMNRDFAAVRAELDALFKGSRFKPWMEFIPLLIILACQLALSFGDEPLERSYDNPWLMFSIFLMGTALTFLVALRVVYFGMITGYAQKGPEGLKDKGVIPLIGPGSQALIVLTAIGMLPMVLGFVFFMTCASWAGSLVFHSVSIAYILCFQLRIDQFVDRFADNVIYLAGIEGKQAYNIENMIKVSRRMFSRSEETQASASSGT
jgi:hypothetical protein